MILAVRHFRLVRAGLFVALCLAPSIAAQSKVDEQVLAAFVAAPEADRPAFVQAHPETTEQTFREALSTAANQTRLRGELANAERMYHALLFLARSAKPPTSEAIAFNGLGIIAGQRSELAAAATYFESAMRAAEASGDVRTVQSGWGNLGIVHRREGDLDLAEVSIRHAIQLAEQLGDKSQVARALNNLGTVYKDQGDGVRALDTYVRSLALKEEIGGDSAELSSTLMNIGGLYDEQGDYAQALHHYTRALDALASGAGTAVGMITVLNNRGHAYVAVGQDALARKDFERALEAAQKAGTTGLVATVLFNLGTLSRAEGKLDESERLQRQAADLREQTGERIGLVESLTELAGLMELRGRAGEALPVAIRAVALAADSRLLNQLWKAQLTEARAHQRLGHQSDARLSYQASIATIERLRQSTAGGDSGRREYLNERVGPYYGLAALETAAGRGFDALAVVEQSRARALIDIVGSGRPPARHLTEPQQRRERELTQKVLVLTAAIESEARASKPNAAKLAQLDADRERARIERDAFTAELYTAQPELGLARASIPQITRESLMGMLDRDTAVVTFVLDQDAAWVYVVTAGSSGPTVFTRRLARGTDKLRQAAEAFARSVGSRDLGFAASARSLYADLLGPVDATLAQRRHLVIVPDGPLWQVPFQALMTTRGHFLVEERAISYAPSLSALAAIEGRRVRRGARPPFLLALGDPMLSRGPAGGSPATAGDRLPEAGREVRALEPLYGASHSVVRTGADASEAALRSDIARASVLHVATHGVLDDRHPMYSHVRLTPGPAGTAPSLADHLTDGRLEAWELLDLDLNADLAVLSACETARGRIGWGEGLIGLSWSLIAAGASTAVVSQWQVDSASTTKLMIAFHDRLLRPADKAGAPGGTADALRYASTEVMKDPAYRHPFYWAGFIAIGAQ